MEPFVPPLVYKRDIVEFRAFRDSLDWATAIVLNHDHRSRTDLIVYSESANAWVPKTAVLHADDPDMAGNLQQSNERDGTGGAWRHTQRTRELEEGLRLIRELAGEACKDHTTLSPKVAAALKPPAEAVVDSKPPKNRGGRPKGSVNKVPEPAGISQPDMDLV